MIQKNTAETYALAVPALLSTLGLDNIQALPRLDKIVVSMGLGACMGDRKKIDEAVTQLSSITGQKAVVTRAKRSVSGFRLREGVDVGCCVTLRKSRMHAFLTRLLYIVLPRVRDFRGLRQTSFDGNGNYSFGLSEQGVFPEIDPERITFPQGMNICIVTTARNDLAGKALLNSLGFPFSKD